MNWAGVGILAIKAGTALVIFGAPLKCAESVFALGQSWESKNLSTHL